MGWGRGWSLRMGAPHGLCWAGHQAASLGLLEPGHRASRCWRPGESECSGDSDAGQERECGLPKTAARPPVTRVSLGEMGWWTMAGGNLAGTPRGPGIHHRWRGGVLGHGPLAEDPAGGRSITDRHRPLRDLPRLSLQLCSARVQCDRSAESPVCDRCHTPTLQVEFYIAWVSHE